MWLHSCPSHFKPAFGPGVPALLPISQAVPYDWTWTAFKLPGPPACSLSRIRQPKNQILCSRIPTCISSLVETSWFSPSLCLFSVLTQAGRLAACQWASMRLFYRSTTRALAMPSRHFAGLSRSRLDPERWAKTKNFENGSGKLLRHVSEHVLENCKRQVDDRWGNELSKT